MLPEDCGALALIESDLKIRLSVVMMKISCMLEYAVFVAAAYG